LYINVTLFAQMIVFALLVWFTMAYVWPPLRQAMNDREQRIADGLAAAARSQSDLENSKVEAEKIIAEARDRAREIVDRAQSRAHEILDAAKADAEAERQRQLDAARAEAELELSRARDELRGQVAAIAMAGAAKVLEREIDDATHRELLDRLASQI
jgi:F-type H+-transporting ATPase subunit b